MPDTGPIISTPAKAARPDTLARRAVRRARDFFDGVAGQLFLYTVGFVLLAQILIYLAAIGIQRDRWVRDMVTSSEMAAMGAETMATRRVSDELADAFFETMGVYTVIIESGSQRELVLEQGVRLRGPIVPIYMTSKGQVQSAPAPLSHLFEPEGRQLHIFSQPILTKYNQIEVRVPEAALKQWLWASSGEAALNSLIISAIAGALIYFTVYRLVVRPMKGLTESVSRFSKSPDSPTITLPSARSAEMRRALAELQEMHKTVSGAFRQRKRLADLGEAVAKINHDLRNSLSAAEILSEGLAHSNDPRVREAAPMLERAIERSITLAESTLRYGRAETPLPRLESVILRDVVAEAMVEGLIAWPKVGSSIDIPEDLRVSADGDHLHRIITNVSRNAAKAITDNADASAPGRVSARAVQRGQAVLLEISDNGPGIAASVLADLFQPFAKASSDGGSGLGLAIARELARGMGGDLELSDSSPRGAVFTLRLAAFA
ncbi:MAG TPA: HAMP domain-containing sensor histidine kinase [Hyphomonadaceae bacterium]|nr:HAMP domain-containing sensor histidine kinase [Hyphomonadaceae bacterium]HPI48186.1 HAMP domain-containing sensor histidine kinase [Hyphomonadaceae bacterium]